MPAPLREIGFDQNLDRQRAARHAVSSTKRAAAVRLGDYFGKRPVVLVFVYYDCPMLCTQVLNGWRARSDVLSLEPGKDFEVVTVSFDPRETPALAAAKKAAYLERYKRPGADAAGTSSPASSRRSSA